MQSLVAAIATECAESLRRADELMTVGTAPVDESNKLGALLASVPEPAMAAPQHEAKHDTAAEAAVSAPSIQVARPATAPDGADWVSQTQQQATMVIDRIRLQDGATGWPYSKVFDARLLNGAVRMTLIDPYLASHHQNSQPQRVPAPCG